jgi:hypothetical protein
MCWKTKGIPNDDGMTMSYFHIPCFDHGSNH